MWRRYEGVREEKRMWSEGRRKTRDRKLKGWGRKSERERERAREDL